MGSEENLKRWIWRKQLIGNLYRASYSKPSNHSLRHEYSSISWSCSSRIVQISIHIQNSSKLPFILFLHRTRFICGDCKILN